MRLHAWLIVGLGPVARSSHPVRVDDRPVDPMAFASAYLHQACARMTDVPTTGALRTEVRGELAGRRTRIDYAAAGRIGIGTGVPAAIGAQLLAIGLVRRRGVFPRILRGQRYHFGCGCGGSPMTVC